MISNITQTPLRTYSRLPKSWEARARLVHYDQADPAIHYEDGWRDYVEPSFDPSTHRLGELIYDKSADLVTREVIELTPEEIKAIQRSRMPQTITPTQGRVMLANMPGPVEGVSLLEAVIKLLPTSKADPVYIYWEYAQYWDRNSRFVTEMAQALGMTEDDIDQFFTLASRIED